MSAKEIEIKVITSKTANEFVKKNHYSKKVVPNSQIHFGVFYKEELGGVLSFGPPLVKKNMVNLVADTKWNDFLELNRMVFLEHLPKNSESRAIGVVMKLFKKFKPNIKWIVSFADGCQCGDGTIYRASGFKLLEIRRNEAIRKNPETGENVHIIQAFHKNITNEFKKWEPIEGNMLKYIYFLDKEYESKLTVPIISFSEIKNNSAGMYKGEKR